MRSLLPSSTAAVRLGRNENNQRNQASCKGSREKQLNMLLDCAVVRCTWGGPELLERSAQCSAHACNQHTPKSKARLTGDEGPGVGSAGGRDHIKAFLGQYLSGQPPALERFAHHLGGEPQACGRETNGCLLLVVPKWNGSQVERMKDEQEMCGAAPTI